MTTVSADKLTFYLAEQSAFVSAVGSSVVSAVSLAGMTVACTAACTAGVKVADKADVTAVSTAEGMAGNSAGIMAVGIADSSAGYKSPHLQCRLLISSDPSFCFVHYLKLYYANGNNPTYLGDTLKYTVQPKVF